MARSCKGTGKGGEWRSERSVAFTMQPKASPPQQRAVASPVNSEADERTVGRTRRSIIRTSTLRAIRVSRIGRRRGGVKPHPCGLIASLPPRLCSTMLERRGAGDKGQVDDGSIDTRETMEKETGRRRQGREGGRPAGKCPLEGKDFRSVPFP